MLDKNMTLVTRKLGNIFSKNRWFCLFKNEPFQFKKKHFELLL